MTTALMLLIPSYFNTVPMISDSLSPPDQLCQHLHGVTCPAPRRDYCLYSVPSAWTELPLCSFSLKVKITSFSRSFTPPHFPRKPVGAPSSCPGCQLSWGNHGVQGSTARERGTKPAPSAHSPQQAATAPADPALQAIPSEITPLHRQGRAQSPWREVLAVIPSAGAAIPANSAQVTATLAEQCHTAAPVDVQLLLEQPAGHFCIESVP